MIGGSPESRDFLPAVTIEFVGAACSVKPSITGCEHDWIRKIEQSFNDRRRNVESISKICGQVDTNLSSEAVEVDLVSRFLSQSPMSPLVELFNYC